MEIVNADEAEEIIKKAMKGPIGPEVFDYYIEHPLSKKEIKAFEYMEKRKREDSLFDEMTECFHREAEIVREGVEKGRLYRPLFSNFDPVSDLFGSLCRNSLELSDALAFQWPPVSPFNIRKRRKIRRYWAHSVDMNRKLFSFLKDMDNKDDVRMLMYAAAGWHVIPTLALGSGRVINLGLPNESFGEYDYRRPGLMGSNRVYADLTNGLPFRDDTFSHILFSGVPDGLIKKSLSKGLERVLKESGRFILDSDPENPYFSYKGAGIEKYFRNNSIKEESPQGFEDILAYRIIRERFTYS